MRRSIELLGVFALASSGCASQHFDPPEHIEKDRPLAGQVSVVGDENRATPGPGESANYQLLVVSPGPEVPWTYLFAVCRFGRGSDNIGTCDPDAPLVALSPLDAPQALPPDTLPAIMFQVPDAATLAPDEGELLVQGLLCPNSPFDPALLASLTAGDLDNAISFPNPCADKSKNGLILSSPFRIERDPTDRNMTPSIATVSWSQAAMKSPIASGMPWTSRAGASTPVNGCQGQGFLELKTQKDAIGIQVELVPGAREAYQERSIVPGEAPTAKTEIPRVLGYASAGDFDIVRDNQQMDGQILQLTWRTPAADKVDPAGTLVRFWFLLGDDRDVDHDAEAVSWTDRALCVLP